MYRNVVTFLPQWHFRAQYKWKHKQSTECIMVVSHIVILRTA